MSSSRIPKLDRIEALGHEPESQALQMLHHARLADPIPIHVQCVEFLSAATEQWC